MLSAVEERVITMDPEEARDQLEDYRAELHKRADAEYEAIAEGLEAMVDGRRLLDVRNAIVAGGFDENGRPRLAIARADRRQVRCDWNRGRLLTFRTSSPHVNARGWALDITYTLSEGEHPEWEKRNGWPRTPDTGHALVPIIPPKVRRESGVVGSRDREHHILFEVDEWASEPRRALPDHDPYLLRHLGGDLFIILGAWDLTPLEQAIMAGRRG